MEIGKIPPKLLEDIVLNPIMNSNLKRDDIIMRPKTGEDCAAFFLGDEYGIVSTDPITGAQNDMGYIAVHINCNDIFSSGGEPVGIMMTVLLPPNSSEDSLKEIMDGAIRAAKEVGIEILGGHTEITDAVNKPLISATVIGKTINKKIVSTGGAVVGQDVIMTKWAGLEGTAIIAKDYETELKSLLSYNTITDAQNFKGFLSVATEAKIAIAHGATAMHDATEGGILGAVWEVADCSGVGICLVLDSIPVKNETKMIADVTEINPYALISSGTLIITAFDGESLLQKLADADVEAAIIGKVTKESSKICQKGQERELNQPQSDEIYRVKFNKV